MEGLSQLPSWMSAVVFPILLTGQSDHTQSTVVLKPNTSQVGITLKINMNKIIFMNQSDPAL
jgi:hypothetical protein